MAKKLSSSFLCENCGEEYVSWQGRCDSCGEWGTIVEHKFPDIVTQMKSGKYSGKIGSQGSGPGKKSLSNLQEIDKLERQKISTLIPELDRVLGQDQVSGQGGVVPSSAILLTGEPGVGKSTILLQLAVNLAINSRKVMYISAEESLAQIGGRAERLGVNRDDEAIAANLRFANSYELEEVLGLMVENDSEFIILDSIQTISSSETRGVPGGMAQVKYCASQLVTLSKQLGKTLIIVGHITKEGVIAGPKILEHLVDVVLQFSGDEKSQLRVMRSHKNRFGSTEEVGIFNMTETGVESVVNPGEYFLQSEGSSSSIGACRTVIMEGTRPLIVELQTLVVPTDFSLPKRVSQGIVLARVQMIAAVLLKYGRLKISQYDIYANVARNFKIDDRASDLALALAIASSIKNQPLADNAVAIGEINLSGAIVEPQYYTKRIKELKTLGYKNIYDHKTFSHISQVAKIFKS